MIIPGSTIGNDIGNINIFISDSSHYVNWIQIAKNILNHLVIPINYNFLIKITQSKIPWLWDLKNSPPMIEQLSVRDCGYKFTCEATPAKLFQFSLGTFIKVQL